MFLADLLEPSFNAFIKKYWSPVQLFSDLPLDIHPTKDAITAYYIIVHVNGLHKGVAVIVVYPKLSVQVLKSRLAQCSHFYHILKRPVKTCQQGYHYFFPIKQIVRKESLFLCRISKKVQQVIFSKKALSSKSARVGAYFAIGLTWEQPDTIKILTIKWIIYFKDNPNELTII